MPNEVGNRTDRELAESLFGKKSVVKEDPQGDPGKVIGTRGLDEIAKSVYPEKNPLYADVDDNGRVSTVIRRLETGEILAQGQSFTEGATLAARSSPLPYADLTGIKLAGKTLSHSNFHDSSISGCDCEGLSAKWSDLRNIDAKGANLSKADLAFSDIRGMVVDEKTDISGVNFTGCAIDEKAYNALIKCKGAGSAKGLAVREMPPEKR